jgi:hypothetical protein
MMQKIRLLLVFGVLCLCCTLCGYGQATAGSQITGTVADPSGAVIPGATIVATQTDSGFTRTTVSNANGSFTFPNLLVGPYRLNVTAAGFSQVERTGLVLQVDTNPTVNVTLKPGAVSSKVVVNANTLRVETHSNAISNVIDQKHIVDLPLDGRNVANLILLTGATSNGVASGNDLIGSKNYGNGAGDSPLILSVAGTQSNSVYYLMDGGDFNDAFTNVALPFPYPDALQEFSVQTTGLGAEYGYHMGAVVSAVTVQGTNHFHGKAFEFIRNYAFNAASTVLNYTGLPKNFTKPRDSLKRNQFGGQIGGPILHNKLFFFGGTQITDNSQKSGLLTVVVPTPAVLQNGDWSAIESPPCRKATNQLKDPSMTGNPNFTGNQIPTGRYNASALAMLANIPVPTDTTCGIISYQTPTSNNETMWLARLDYQLSPSNLLFTRYLFSGYHTPKLYGGNLLLTATNGTDDRAMATVIGDTWTLTPNLVNTAHINYTHLFILRGDATDMPTPAKYGIDITTQIPYFFTLTGPFNVGNGTGAPATFADSSSQGSDDLNWLHGRHSFAFGVDYIRNILNEAVTTAANGQFAFGSNTGDSLADFMLGDMQSFLQNSPSKLHFIQNYLGVYGQDTFKMNNRVTLNAGVRWEPFIPIYDRFGEGSNFQSSLWNQAGNSSSTEFTNAPPGLVFSKDAGVPRGFVNKRLWDFAPRVGFIADLTGQGNMTLRGSYGIFYDTPEIFYPDQYQNNQPFSASFSITNPVTPSNPVGTFSSPYAGVPGGNPFPIAFPPSADAAFVQQTKVVTIPQNVHPTYAEEWNLSLQRQFGTNWLTTISYLGTATHHVWLGRDINAAPLTTDPVIYNNWPVNSRRPYNGFVQTGPGAGVTGIGPLGAGSSTNPKDPSLNLPYSAIVQTYDGTNASYNALLASVDHRLSNHFTLLSNFTWSHCMDTGEFLGELSGNSFQDPTNPKGDYGTCGADHTMRLNNSLVIAGPDVRRTLVGEVLGGWTTSAIVTYQSGDPLTMAAGVDYSRTGTNRDRANQIPGVSLYPAGGRSSQEWFNVNAFAWVSNPDPTERSNPIGTYGTSSVSVTRGPRSVGWAEAFQRTFPLYKQNSLMLRVDVFNVLNHQGLGDPNTNAHSTNFGVITGGANGPRTMQGALEYQF